MNAAFPTPVLLTARTVVVGQRAMYVKALIYYSMLVAACSAIPYAWLLQHRECRQSTWADTRWTLRARFVPFTFGLAAMSVSLVITLILGIGAPSYYWVSHSRLLTRDGALLLAIMGFYSAFFGVALAVFGGHGRQRTLATLGGSVMMLLSVWANLAYGMV